MRMEPNEITRHGMTAHAIPDRRTPDQQWEMLEPYAWAECVCGWRSVKVETWDAAYALGDAHLVKVVGRG